MDETPDGRRLEDRVIITRRRSSRSPVNLGSPGSGKLITFSLRQLRQRHGEQGSRHEEASLVGSKHVRLRVGVIGLGRLWETRHKPSLARLDDQFRVTAVYDPVFRRAELEAAQMGCAACEGLSALVERTDVDVIYLLSRQWFGLHPIGLACAAGKAVYWRCAAGRRVDRAGIVRQTGRPERDRVHAGVRTLLLSGDVASQELLATQWGPRVWSWDTYDFTVSIAMRSRARHPDRPCP